MDGRELLDDLNRVEALRVGRPVLILAKDWPGAREAARELGLEGDTPWRWVASEHDLQSHSRIRIHYGPDYTENPNWPKIRDHLDAIRDYGTVEEI